MSTDTAQHQPQRCSGRRAPGAIAEPLGERDPAGTAGTATSHMEQLVGGGALVETERVARGTCSRPPEVGPGMWHAGGPGPGYASGPTRCRVPHRETGRNGAPREAGPGRGHDASCSRFAFQTRPAPRAGNAMGSGTGVTGRARVSVRAGSGVGDVGAVSGGDDLVGARVAVVGTRLELDRPDVEGDTGGSGHAALVGCFAGRASTTRDGRVAGVERRASRREGMGQGRAAVVLQRAEQRVDAAQIVAREAAGVVAVEV